jgi:uncharacterized peroxidase-related enzyme
MTWIKYVPYTDADGRLGKLYQKYKRPNDTIANIISAHSLRPHMLEGHMALYRSIIGHAANELPLWFLEAIGVYVSALNQCRYCIDHHSHFGGRAYPGTNEEWNGITTALVDGQPADRFEGKMLALLGYARQLTLRPSGTTEECIQILRAAGANDGEILETNQVVGYFAYANRTVLGLGVTLDGETHAN